VAMFMFAITLTREITGEARGWRREAAAIS